MFAEDLPAERLALHKGDRFNPAQPASGKAESADTGEGVNHAQHGHLPSGITVISAPGRSAPTT